MFDQIQCYSTVNKLKTDFQHAYREEHSTITALTQITDDWLREIDDKNIVVAGLLDFSAVFYISNQSLLLEKKHVLWLYTPCYIVDNKLPV